MTMYRQLFITAAVLLITGCSSGKSVKPAEDSARDQEAQATPSMSQTRSVLDEPTATPSPSGGSQADADVTYVRAIQAKDGSWTFHVTVTHPDTSWEDYADGWDVVTPDGVVIKVNETAPYTRLLLHPHENEQPFTRSQGNLILPDNVNTVTVRAHDIVDGFGGAVVTVDLTAEAGQDFEVERQ